MRAWIACLVAAMALPAGAAVRPEPPIAHSPALDKLLAKSVADRPVDCISLPRAGSSTTVSNPDTILYRIGGVKYVNQPAGGCNFRLDPIIVSRTPSTRLCRGDIISVIERGSGFATGSCVLGSFTPYRPTK